MRKPNMQDFDAGSCRAKKQGQDRVRVSCTAPAPTSTPQSTVAVDAPLLLLCALLPCLSCTLTGALLLGPSTTRLMPLLKVMVSGGSASARVCTAEGRV